MMRLDRIHRAWFAATFICGVLLVAVLPPFQGNDEDSHHRRVWSVAQGDAYCREMPEAANELTRVVHFPEPDHSKRQSFGADDLKRGWQRRGYNIPRPIISTSCGYFPIAYVPSAIVARLIGLNLQARPRQGGMIAAFYGERLINWILASAAFLFALRRLPWARTVLLTFFSVPEVIQQSVALGVDWLLIGGTAMLTAFVFSTPRWRNVVGIIVVATLMTATKPVFVFFVLGAVPVAVVLASPRWKWRHACIAPALAMPFFVWRWWFVSVPSGTLRGDGPEWVDTAKQLAYVKAHPAARVASLLAHQLWQTFFDRDLMHGHWTSILGSFGWNAFRMAMPAYYLLLAGVVAAVVADLAIPSPLGTEPRFRRWWLVGDFALVVAALMATSATVVAMYIYFTAPALPGVNGVQGRYYLPSLLLVGIVLLHVSPRSPSWLRFRRPATLIAFASCVVADAAALVAIRQFYWR